MRCVIVAGGDEGEIRSYLREDDFIIAADRGYEYLENAGVKPDLFVGDRDSYHHALPEDLPKALLQSRKDDTDMMSAVKEGILRGYEDFLFLCAFGGRLDHLLGNVAVMAYILDQSGSAEMTDDKHRVRMFSGEAEVVVSKKCDYVSLLCYSDDCLGVTTKNLSYPLSDATLKNSFPLGVSNEVLDRERDAGVSLKNGKLLVIEVYL